MSLLTNPSPLGKICPGAAWETAAVRATVNLPDLQAGARDARVSDLVIQAHADNDGLIFITNDGLPPAADYSNVLRELAAGQFYSAGSVPAPNAVDSRNYYVAAQNDTDFALGEVREG